MPTSSGFFDSVEPRCTSQTVTRIMRKNCRYSDCQFSATSTAKLEDVTYAQNETRIGSGAELILVVACEPGDRLAEQREQEDRPEEQRQPVVAQEPLHRCTSPSTMKYANPSTRMTSSVTNSART